MTSFSKGGIAVVLIVLFASVALIQQHITTQSLEYGVDFDPAPALPGVPAQLPRLVNLKTESCIHCKRMIPVLLELQNQYAQAFTIYTFDVGTYPEIGRSFGGIRTVPTLVFFDQSGRELYRFEGYMSKSEILHRWRRLGFEV
jgi:thioredoxin 1